MSCNRIAAAGVLAALALAGCTDTERVLSRQELERGVSATLTQAKQPHEKVSCPGPIDAKIAESTECRMTAQGSTYKLTVVVMSVEGDQANYEVDIDPKPIS